MKRIILFALITISANAQTIEPWEEEPLRELDELITSGKEKLGVKVCYDYNQITHDSTEIKKQAKVTSKQLKIWDNIAKAASEEDANEMIRGCHKLISVSELDDSLAYKARLLMAKYYLAKGDINDVYESFLYFRYYAAYHLDTNASSIRDELWLKYWNLVDKLRIDNNLDGYYLTLNTYWDSYSGRTDCDYNMLDKETWAPFYGVEIKGNEMRLFPICTIARWCGVYMTTAAAKATLKSFATIQQVTQDVYTSYNDKLLYYTEWSYGKFSKGDTDMASIVVDHSTKMRAEGAATVAQYSKNTRETLLGTAAVTAVSGAFTALADLISTTKETAYAFNNGFSFMNYLVLFGDMTWAKEKMVNGRSTSYKKNRNQVFLVHILPHLELYLKDISGLICSRTDFGDIKIDEYLKHYAATCYPLGNKYGHTNKDINNRKKFSQILDDVQHSAYNDIADSFINSYRDSQN